MIGPVEVRTKPDLRPMTPKQSSGPLTTPANPDARPILHLAACLIDRGQLRPGSARNGDLAFNSVG